MKFSLRDLFWLTIVVALSIGWWCDHRWEEGKLVTGVVTATNNRDLVEVSLGTDDGLKTGHTMEVHRGKTYLGKGIVRMTGPDRAVILMGKLHGKIQKGDRVTTGFSS